MYLVEDPTGPDPADRFDQSGDRGRYTLGISFDMDPALDEKFYAQVVATVLVTALKERALVRSAVLEDLYEGADV